jgi:hypothetical protein
LCRWPRQKHAVASRETVRRARHWASPAHTLPARQLLRVHARARGSRPAARTQTGANFPLVSVLVFVVGFCCSNHFVSNADSVSCPRVALFQKREEKRALTFWSGNRFPFQDRLGTQASGQFEKLETKPKTAFLTAKKRPRMTKRWHRLEKYRFAPLCTFSSKTTKIFYQDRLGTSTRMKCQVSQTVRKTAF